jgi:hypothetical protein
MPTYLEASPASRLSTGSSAAPIGVDRKQNALIGMVVAIEGDFKTPGRGSFDGDSLQRIVMLGNKWSLGLRSNWTHGNLCGDSLLGAHLGRAKNFRLAVAKRYDGEPVRAVRADLFFDPTAMKEPPRGGGRPLGDYLMELAANDPSALSSSLVGRHHQIKQLDAQGKQKVDERGNPLPPRWYPYSLTSTDVVPLGDAVDGVLSADPLSAMLSLATSPQSLALPNEIVVTASAMLDRLFSGRDRGDVASRIDAFKAAYLSRRFGG